jgi:effector-binding domain-containing protein
MTKKEVQMHYTWDITSINDSVTKVNVGIKDLNHSWYNKLTVPFFNTEFKQEQIKKITDFKKGLSEHLKNFKVRIDGEGVSEETFVAYINLKSVLQEKARYMIANDALITGFLFENQIKIIGRPYLEIVKWDLDKETIDFNYCFPVEKPTNNIVNDVVKFKTLPVVKGLKATYYGNFRTSDRAWFALMDYAKKNNLKLENKVLEHFLSNPFNGGEELQWETKIIIPFASK